MKEDGKKMCTIANIKWVKSTNATLHGKTCVNEYSSNGYTHVEYWTV